MLALIIAKKSTITPWQRSFCYIVPTFLFLLFTSLLVLLRSWYFYFTGTFFSACFLSLVLCLYLFLVLVLVRSCIFLSFSFVLSLSFFLVRFFLVCTFSLLLYRLFILVNIIFLLFFVHSFVPLHLFMFRFAYFVCYRSLLPGYCVHFRFYLWRGFFCVLSPLYFLVCSSQFNSRGFFIIGSRIFLSLWFSLAASYFTAVNKRAEAWQYN